MARMEMDYSLKNLSLQVLQSIYVTRDRVILKFEARVQIYIGSFEHWLQDSEFRWQRR